MKTFDDLDHRSAVDTLYLTINAPEDGGITVYEALDGGDPKPKFSGDLSQAVKYLEMRMSKVLRTPGGKTGETNTVKSFADIRREATGRLADISDAG